MEAFEHLFFAVFGMSSVKDVQKSGSRPQWTEYLFKIMFMVYMSVSVVVLINLLIAMMSDTYQRIQAQSDIEWKYGLAKLIRNMHRTTTTPSPLNLMTSWFMYLLQLCKQKGEFHAIIPTVFTTNALFCYHKLPKILASLYEVK